MKKNKKLEWAKYVTVLDFEIGRIFQYKIEDWDISNKSCDEFVNIKGHRLSNCEWMVHEEPRVITTNHKAYQ